ncbi:polyprotein [Hirsutella rhossiliensis]
MKLFGGLIGWRANKQDTVTTSTTEAELLALSQTAKESIYMSRLIDELGVKLDASHIRIQCDNNQTIRLVNAEIAALKTKLRHVNIHNHWLRQEVANGTIEVTYTPSAELMADGLTKALQGPHFEAFVKQMGLEDVTSLLAGRSLPETDDEELQEQIYEVWHKEDKE